MLQTNGPIEHRHAGSTSELFDFWRTRGRIPVPGKSGAIHDLLMVELTAPARVDDQLLDALVRARATLDTPEWPAFGVRVSGKTASPCSIPVLWIDNQRLDATGSFVLPNGSRIRPRVTRFPGVD